MLFHPKVQALFDWLLDGAPGAPTPMAVLARVGPDLVAGGVPLDRMTAFVRTLHPSVVGRRFSWEKGKLGKQVLLSEPLAKVLTVPTRSVGSFELKGITEKAELFECISG